MYDNICKFIAEQFPEDLAGWLLGRSISLSELSPAELFVEPIRADSLILLAEDDSILHLEFQTSPDREIPFRMTDYRLRIYRRFPEKSVYQVVIYLKPSRSPLVYQNSFEVSRTRHEFDVIRLWEQPTEIFFQSIGLLPFAVLSRTDKPDEVLASAGRAIENLPDRATRSNLAACTEILAGLVLKKEMIQRVLREEIVRESVIYQEILQRGIEQGIERGIEQGIERGIEQGIEQGIERGIEQVALNLLREGIAIEQVARLTGLSVERIQQLRTT